MLTALILGTVLALVAGFAIWVGLGSGKWMRRATRAILGASLLGLFFCAAIGEYELEWLGLAWVVMVTATAMLLLVRGIGFQLVDTERGDGVRPDPLQFSVTQLMALTAVVAAIAAVARMLAPLVATIEALIFGLAIAICLGTLAIMATWVVLRPKRTRYANVALAVTTILIAGLVYYGVEATNVDPGLLWAAVVIAYTFALAIALKIARRRGLRLLSTAELTLSLPVKESS